MPVNLQQFISGVPKFYSTKQGLQGLIDLITQELFKYELKYTKLILSCTSSFAEGSTAAVEERGLFLANRAYFSYGLNFLLLYGLNNLTGPDYRWIKE